MKLILPVFSLKTGKQIGNTRALKRYIRWAETQGYDTISELPFNELKKGCTSPFSSSPFGLNFNFSQYKHWKDLSFPFSIEKEKSDIVEFLNNNEWLDYAYMKRIAEQFLIHTEQLQVKRLCENLNIKREVSMAFGVDSESEFVKNNPNIFDTELELGTPCGQKWGLPAFKINDNYYEFIKKRFIYLKQYVDIIFLDHMCGYVSQYVYDKNGNSWFDIPEWDIWKRKDRLRKIINIALSVGLEVRGETLGDWGRQSICEEVLEEYKIPKMWVATQQDHIPDNVELYLTTHDTPTLRQILKGERQGQRLYDFPKGRIINLLNNLLGNHKNWEEEMLTERIIFDIIESVKKRNGVVGIWDYFEGDWNINFAGTSCSKDSKNFNLVLPDIGEIRNGE